MSYQKSSVADVQHNLDSAFLPDVFFEARWYAISVQLFNRSSIASFGTMVQSL